MTRLAFLLATLALFATCSDDGPANQPASQPETPTTGQADTSEDPWLWLEEVEGEEALAWVEEQNASSTAYLEALDTFEPMRDRNLSIYDSEDRIPSPGMRGDYVYNFCHSGSPAT